MLPEAPETSSVPNIVIDSTCDGLLNMIAVLIKNRDDLTPHGVATLRRIYSKMYTTKEWNYKISGYKRKTSTSTRPSKMVVIMANTKMRKQCAEVVAQMLEDISKKTIAM